MLLNPMEWIRCVSSVFGRAPFVLVMTLTLSTAVSAAVLRLNPGDNPDNVITFEGTLEATVVQSAAGMDITLPGVKLTLDCQGDPTTSCVVSVGSAPVTSAPETPTTNSPNTDSQTPGTSTPNTDPAESDDSDCVDDNTSFGGGASCEDDSETPESESPASAAPPTGSIGSGYDLPPSSNDQDDGAGISSGWVLAPAPENTGPEPTREKFPESDRVAYQATPDMGSAGGQRFGNTQTIKLGLQTVAVMPYTMSAVPASGGLGFYEPSSSPAGGALVFWISRTQDGAAVSAACTHKGGYDGKLSVSSEANAPECALEPGVTYYLNVATCYGGDGACRGAETAYEAGEVLMAGSW